MGRGMISYKVQLNFIIWMLVFLAVYLGIILANDIFALVQ